MSFEQKLTPEKALIFRIVHRDNVPWILENGQWSRGSGRTDANFVTIGNTDLIGKRAGKPVPIPPGGVLSEYIPFYFTPYSPMLLNIITGRGVRKRAKSELVLLVSSLHDVVDAGCEFVFTDRHAFLSYITDKNYSNRLEDLGEMVPWPHLQARDFAANPDVPDKLERYQAEALVFRYLPVDALRGAVTYDGPTASRIEESAKKLGVSLPVYVKPSWFF